MTSTGYYWGGSRRLGKTQSVNKAWMRAQRQPWVLPTRWLVGMKPSLSLPVSFLGGQGISVNV